MPAMRLPAVSGSLIGCACLLLSWVSYADFKPGPGQVPFWLSVSDAHLFDRQVIELLSEQSAVVALRLHREKDDPTYSFPGIARRLHQKTTSPLLLYTWVSRYKPGDGPNAEAMDWLDDRGDLLIAKIKDPSAKQFGDVTNSEYRDETVNAIVQGLVNSNTDGIAIDGAMRTPKYRPKVMAKRCRAEPGLCEAYARGVSSIFSSLRDRLDSKTIIYNGLWNVGADSIADQLTLLEQADAAIIEYFGMNPRADEHAFQSDILPYLDAMSQIPSGRAVMVFGRAPWNYTDYADDYGWQRYLYCAYLLAKSDHSYFKYHATFQVPTSAGRTGGLDIYADWSVPIGTPNGAYALKNGVYSRDFKNGAVYVAPDDGAPTTLIELPHEMYTPEGERLVGRIPLAAGTGLLLLKTKPPQPVTQRSVDLAQLTDWQGANWTPAQSGTPAYLSLSDGPELGAAGQHDVLLDASRTKNPMTTLKMSIRAHDATSNIIAVAEIDDPKRRKQNALVILSAEACGAVNKAGPAVQFRVAANGKGPQWPTICLDDIKPAQWQTIELNGPSLFGQSKYTFRGWRHMRVLGGADLESVRLSGGID